MICLYCYRWCRRSNTVSRRDSTRHAWRCKRDGYTSNGIRMHTPDAINATVGDWADG